MTNSRDKGKRGELEWAAELRKHGADAARGRQYHGRDDAPDVVCSWPVHFEVKRVQQLRLGAAMRQAMGDCGEAAVPAVAHRMNNQPWLVTMRADDLLPLLAAIYGEEA